MPEAWGQIGPLLIDSRGRFWVNAAEPLRFSEDGQRLLPPERPVADVPWVIYEDRQGTIWHGTPSGLYRLLPEAAEATLHRLVEGVNESPHNFVAPVIVSQRWREDPRRFGPCAFEPAGPSGIG